MKVFVCEEKKFMHVKRESNIEDTLYKNSYFIKKIRGKRKYKGAFQGQKK